MNRRFMSWSGLLAGGLVLGPGLAYTQTRPPGPQPIGAYATITGAISQLNYGPELEVRGFVLNNNTIVTFPPHAGVTLSPVVKSGDNVTVSGYQSNTYSGLQRLDLTSLTDATSGKTFTIPQPGQFTSYGGEGRVTQLNYNDQGEVDGFFLDNGVFAKAPPFSAALRSMVSVGSSATIEGYAHQTVSGRTIVDVQSLNGQAINYGPRGAPPPPPSPGAPPRRPGL
jgi:hypothetical protein